MKKIYALLIIFCIIKATNAQTITTFAGHYPSSPDTVGNGRQATAATLGSPLGLTADAAGNIYIAENITNRVQKVSTSGIITTIAGSGYAYSTGGYAGDGGPATAALLNNTWDVAVDRSGNVYIADYGNYRIRKVAPSGTISTFAGNGSSTFSGDGGAATAAGITSTDCIAVDRAGNVYIGCGNHIRKVNTSGIISTFAGIMHAGASSGDGGAATAANISTIQNITFDAIGNLYLIDGSAIRKIDTSGTISLFAGNYGTTSSSGDGGAATDATFWVPQDITIDGSGNVYIADGMDRVIRKVSPSGIISLFAGTYGSVTDAGDGGAATAASFENTIGMTADVAGNIYVSDNTANVVRKINAGGSHNHTPFFGASPYSVGTLCNNVSYNLNSLLRVTDADTSQTLTWSSVAAPRHGTATVAYTATSTGSLITPTGLSYTPDSGFAGYDTLQVQVSDGYAAATVKIIMNVHPAPAAGVISAPSTICRGSFDTLTATPTGGSWATLTPGRVLFTYPARGVLLGSTPGTGSFTYTLTNSYGCKAVTTQSITVVTPVPNNIITVPSNVCAGSTMMLTDTISGGTWTSVYPSIATIDPSSGVVTGLRMGIDTIRYAVTNVCGTRVVKARISVDTLADTISGPSSMCTGTYGASSLFSDYTPFGTWSGSGITTEYSYYGSSYLQAASVGTTTITYTINNSCGISHAYKSVTVNLSPNPGTISGGMPFICTHDTITLSPDIDTFTNYISGGVWAIDYPSIATINPSGSSVVVSPVGTGYADLSYTVTLGSCSTTIYTSVAVNPTPYSGIISGPPVICNITTLQLHEDVPGGTWASMNTSVASIANTGFISTYDTGSSAIRYAVINRCGVTGYSYKTMPVYPTPDMPVITGPAIVCGSGGTTTLSATPTGGYWGSMDANTRTDTVTGVVTGIGGGISHIYYNGPYNSYHCRTQARTSINVIGVPNPGTLSGSSTICPGASTAFTPSVPGGAWNSSNLSVVTVNSSGSVTGVNTGTALVSYTVSNSCFSSFVPKVITVSGPTTLGPIGGIPYVSVGATDVFTNAVPGGTWSVSNTSLASLSSTGTMTGLAAGYDTVIYSYTNTCGITSSVFKEIRILSAHSGRMAGNVSGSDDQNAIFRIYPNPTTGIVTINIEGASGMTEAQVFDITGRVVAAKSNDTPGMEIDFSGLPTGAYVVRVSNAGNIYTERVMLR